MNGDEEEKEGRRSENGGQLFESDQAIEWRGRKEGKEGMEQGRGPGGGVITSREGKRNPKRTQGTGTESPIQGTPSYGGVAPA